MSSKVVFFFSDWKNREKGKHVHFITNLKLVSSFLWVCFCSVCYHQLIIFVYFVCHAEQMKRGALTLDGGLIFLEPIAHRSILFWTQPQSSISTVYLAVPWKYVRYSSYIYDTFNLNDPKYFWTVKMQFVFLDKLFPFIFVVALLK